MALITCPECGNKCSSLADSCPKCGYPIKRGVDGIQDIQSQNYPKAKNSSWVLSWKRKAHNTKLVWTTILILNNVLLAIFICLMNFDKDVNFSSFDAEPFYSVKIIYIIFTFVLSLACLIVFVIWIAVLIDVKVRVMQFDGYNVVVYAGSFKKYLIVENSIQDKGHRYLYGRLPNNKQVWATTSIWDNSIDMGIGSKEKQSR